ncbi:BEL1-like homeodomain protein 11 [Vicia villosa]|uniref:BEL1-like homeodomain protein 11 n=1 Tax=Vicia villosa TaxID=3911 RepID=UPI00273C6A38|nr:BEL1-like homeodomain protein 11 [Vicia villosa]
MSNSMTHQNQFENQDLLGSGYVSSSSLRNNNAYSQTFHHNIEQLSQGSEMSHTRHLMDLLGAANDNNNHQTQQGLSLSLGSHMLVVPTSDEYRNRSLNQGLMTINPTYFMSAQEQTRDQPVVENNNNNNLTSDYFYGSFGSGGSSNNSLLNRSTSTSYGNESFGSVIGNSRYLKPVQSLLEDLVDVGGNVIDRMNEKYAEKLFHASRTGARTLSSELKAELRIHGHLLADKHEHQVKIAKLISLLDEVESRYEKYYHQMEEVVSSFEMIAGLGAAKCYTALALQAMSRHFCSLRDAIMSQINVEKRKLFQDVPKINNGLSQLSLFERENNSNNRQNRMSLQQLGIIQNQRQVWRPIRGLPETSVAILRAWLFEHFLHPYPNDSEKLMLASQTGLTKNQVSNWFINARVRLWKPMIEEMYKEEFGDSSEDSNPAANNYMSREDATDCVED